jgi:ribonuclease HIII
MKNTETYSLALLQTYDYELFSACTHLIGIDEAGRGCLADPVTAAACFLSRALFVLLM